MGRIAIITESSSNIPPELVSHYDIHVLPLRIIWGDEVLKDGIDISPQDFYRRLRSDESIPSTSSITPGELLQAVNELGQDVDAVVAILLANELSSSVESAEAVKQMSPDRPLYIVDSRTAAMAQGFVVLEAARAAAEGASVEEVIEKAASIINRVYLFGMLETLKYLHKGGRIGSVSLFMGTALQIKPIVAIYPGTGKVLPLARPRTSKGAIDKMLNLIDQEVGQRPLHIAVSHGDLEELAAEVADELGSRFNVRELHTTYFTPVMGAHAGPVLALCFYAEDEAS